MPLFEHIITFPRLTFEESHTQLADWLKDVEKNLAGDLQLKGTVTEKQEQMQELKAVLADIVSHRHAVDVLCERDQKLQSTPSETCSKLVTKYEALLEDCQVRFIR